MEILNNWIFWVIIYLISAIFFAQLFKRTNQTMKNAGSMTVLLELFTALFALILSVLFEFKISTNPRTYLTLFIVTIIYAATDRLNIEARYGLQPSVFSMLKQLSTVFLIIFSFLFLKEQPTVYRITGGIIILSANLLLSYNKGKFEFNKYFMMSIVSNILFAIAMLININISDEFNLGIYTVITVFIPSIIISLLGKHTIKKLKEEFNLYNKKQFVISAFCWSVMLISSVRAYQLGNVSLIAPLFSLTSIINSIYEYFITKDKNILIKNLIMSILIVIGVILIKQ